MATFPHLTHLEAMALFALVVSVGFGMLGRRRPIERLKYAAWWFVLLLIVAIAIGWAMYPYSH